MDLDDLNELEERIQSLQAENSDLNATIAAVRAQLSVFDSLILYPTYTKQLAAYPEAQRPIVELAMKANFYKKRKIAIIRKLFLSLIEEALAPFLLVSLQCSIGLSNVKSSKGVCSFPKYEAVNLDCCKWYTEVLSIVCSIYQNKHSNMYGMV
ncbi:hypothetical protein SUGI_0453540 [Cryptomeria japonica]|nr:hypothetical protein SUGI_0453540 [Cryptomeria japonica]